MKNVNTFLTIKSKYPFLKQNKNTVLSLIVKNKSINAIFPNVKNSSIYKARPLSLHKNIRKTQQSIGLIKPIPPYILLEKNKTLKPSSSDFNMTKIKYMSSNDGLNLNPTNFLRQKISPSLSLFKTQINNYQNMKNLKNKSKNSPKRKNNKEKEKEENSPKLKYLGNLIKFKKNKKNLKKNIKSEIIRQEDRQDYLDFINKKRKIFFNPKSTSHYAHERSTDYLLYTIQKTKSYQILQPNYIVNAKSKKEEMDELRDEVPNLPFNVQKLMQRIRSLFSQDYKFNNKKFNQAFFHNYEDKINFIFDIYRVPVFKNNLVKIILNKNEYLEFEEWKNINVINSTTWNYLNMVKTNIQREKDEKLKREKELELKKKEEEDSNFGKKKRKSKKNKKETKENEKNEENNSSSEESDNNKKIIKEEENYSNIMMNIEKEDKIKEQQYEDLYIVEEYFLNKNNYDNGKVAIASDKLKYLFFHRDEALINRKFEIN